jgi:hypothetical protein
MQAVGGAPNSAHRLGFAADIVPVNVSTLSLARWIKNNTQSISSFLSLVHPKILTGYMLVQIRKTLGGS